MSLPANPVLNYSLSSQSLLVFDDTRNPTFSYKDRASILVALKAIQNNIHEITMASTGNAGSSIAGICARMGLKAHIFVPKAIPLAKRLQIQSYGAQLYLVDGDYDQAFDLNLEVTTKTGWYNRNTAYNPLTIEGKKSAAFDMFLALQGNLPDWIFVPVGDGVILAGLYKGFYDLHQLGWIEKLPKLIAIQSTGSAAVVRYFETGIFEYEPAETIADSIHAGAPRNLFMADDAIKRSGGFAFAVDDSEIIFAQEKISKNLGILTEPAAAASSAGFLKSMKKGLVNQHDKTMLMFTGNGLKDFGSLERWNETPVAKSVVQWREEFSCKNE
ncbi:MAG: pyridoxal-phosphate dependent enzyme [Calditrichaeota bacterium]|nr:pyridoxal-phosphate dependent enzyme [Calditrichota bacterium]